MPAESRRVDWECAIRAIAGLVGDQDQDAFVVADVLLQAEVLGQRRFGLGLLTDWLDRGAVVRPTSSAVSDTALHDWDVTDVFGPLVLARAARLAGETAQRLGIGAIVMRGLGGSGRLAPHVEAIARQGCVGVAFVSAPPAVAVVGGADPVWGTNPFAFSVPGTEDGLTVDTSTAALTQAELRGAQAAGRPLGPGLAVDGQGRETTDPDDVAAILPRGGLMGTLAAMLVEALTSGVAGEVTTPTCRTATLIAVQARSPVADQLIAHLDRASAHRPGVAGRVRIRESREQGIVLSGEDCALLGLA